ncbi:hypothetical protein NON08_01300 [Cetobacterium somerae]|uniref:hypothetical protein n=1 Tax=Cetobacterium sp. NK01 TaxID=2993530 RepID=UPI0021166F4D|nr:hypothetical protein [Cetobacterium sp. NK01]MCQ8211204.1 hypothetical protein [Cetobacterium sp. NK01]
MNELFQEEIRKRREVSNELNGFGYEKEFDNIYNELLNQRGDGFFDTKKDIYVLAALIGFNLYSNQPLKIEKHSLVKKEFRPLSPVDFSEYYHLIYSVALSLNNSIEDILDNKRIVDIFNNCASLGIEKLKEILTKDGEGYIRNFEDFLESPENFLENMFDEEREEREINEVMKIIV